MRYDATPLDGLKTGDRVIITWSNGNGPHEYIVEDYQGLLRAKSIHRPDYDVGLIHKRGDAWTIHQVAKKEPA